ncbi:hypothetical protein N9901_02020 [Flavobacteriaceae bacterium]|nr:hypothetical protein [Flavobacteriaceae bacterium]
MLISVVVFSQNIEEDNSFVIITAEQLEVADDEVSTIVGDFSNTNDTYLNILSFEFQGAYFSRRGFETDKLSFTLNGISQNSLYDNKPIWNNWSGINRIYSSQTIEEPLRIGLNYKTSGLGVRSFSLQPSKYRAGTTFGYLSSNRFYENKIIASVNSRESKKGWRHRLTFSNRGGDRGFREGTSIFASNMTFSLEKQLNKKHTVFSSVILNPSKRGMAAANTNEVLNLKGRNYNQNWGLQNNKIRNAKVAGVFQPIISLNHQYTNKNIALKTNFWFQKGKTYRTRLDYTDAINSDPVYYQNLPSYFLSRSTVDYELLYRKQQELITNGQLNWERLYSVNSELSTTNKANAYVLSADVRDEQTIALNTVFTSRLSNKALLGVSTNYTRYTSDNYARIQDLLGGNYWLDVDSFTKSATNLNRPNRKVVVNERYKYSFTTSVNNIAVLSNYQYKKSHIEYGLEVGLEYRDYLRNGKYLYELNADSFGKSKKVSLFAKRIKVNTLFKLSPKNLLEFNFGYHEIPPGVATVFPNARYSNRELSTIQNENLTQISSSYICRNAILKAKLSGFYSVIKNATDIGFFFGQGFGTETENSAFVQQELTNISTLHKGLEFGLDLDISDSYKLLTGFGIGNYSYANNPNLTVYADDSASVSDLGFENGKKELGKAYLKNKKVAIGPHQGYSIALQYSDPNYWRLKLSLNHFRNNYIGVVPINYTSNFYSELDGSEIPGIVTNQINSLLEQEQLNNFTLFNISGSKSWKVNHSYVLFFWNIQNVLDTEFNSGGYASSRYVNYNQQLENSQREVPLFGTKYFIGNGATYQAGLYVSF